MRLFTGKGDQGDTDLLGARVGKDDSRIDLIGELDETTSAIGLARAMAATGQARVWLIDVQRDLYRIMAELAFTDDIRPEAFALNADRVEWLEQRTDELSAAIELPREFVLPGGTASGGAMDLARAVSRRAERAAVRESNAGAEINRQILRYLNRLSSLLFMLARAEDAEQHERPLPAKKPASEQKMADRDANASKGLP
jgi:cob(I)alamin adenosyltransferase